MLRQASICRRAGATDWKRYADAYERGRPVTIDAGEIASVRQIVCANIDRSPVRQRYSGASAHQHSGSERFRVEIVRIRLTDIGNGQAGAHAADAGGVVDGSGLLRHVLQALADDLRIAGFNARVL